MKTLNITFTPLSAIIGALSGALLQLNGQDPVNGCSYLDPITVDIFAILFSLFLIIEGVYKIIKDIDKPFWSNFTRFVRISLGFAVLTIHILQFVHK
ncbi:hypothetical protein KY328_03560 [Candidatus Woesearchaeota archaeon]|nr:hypothetical protein [Candidatus Woesearchaeota archaeon]MBW3021972.1 hypothetical protein [Candidatus Woesearchaeota archaeon]